MDIVSYQVYECSICGERWTIEEEAKTHECKKEKNMIRERREEISRDLVVIMEQIEMISLSFGASARSKSLLNKTDREKI